MERDGIAFIQSLVGNLRFRGNAKVVNRDQTP